MKIGNEDVKLYLGSVEVEKIYLGTEQVYEGDSTPTPSSDVPLDNTFAVKYQGMWAEGDEPISYIEDIEMQLGGIGVSDPSEVEELAIGNQTSSINLDGNNFPNCTGLTLAPSVADTSDIHNFPAMKWVNVMGDSFEYAGGSGLFSDMNCCPIYVPETSLSDYQADWENETTYDCDGTVADRLIGWTTPSHDYSQDYLTIESIDDNNTIYFTASNTAMTSTISASTDNGTTWTAYTSSTGRTMLATLNTGDKLLLKGTNATYSTISFFTRTNKIDSTERFNVYGNIMSLISGDSFSNADTLASAYTFYQFFQETGVVNAKNLVMPATTLANNCYNEMFSGCTVMTTAPALPATTLANSCYSYMFKGCSSLTTAPALPATTLTSSCYNNMFRDCSSLNYIKCLARNISASNCTNGWVIGVSSSGTFTKAASMSSWTTGSSGIPNNWTVEDDAE